MSPPSIPTSAIGTGAPAETALELLASNQDKEAFRWAVAALTGEPHSPTAQFLVGTCAGRLGNQTVAKTALRLAVDRACEASRLSLAVAAALSLRQWQPDVTALFDSIANTFCKGSNRLGESPPPPLHPPPVFPSADETDINALAKKAAQLLETEGKRTLPAHKLTRQNLFSALSAAALKGLLGNLEFKLLRKQESVIQQGEVGAEAFVLARGALDVYRDRADAAPVTLARLGAGSIFGEMALLSRSPRAANVVAAVPSILLVMKREVLERAAENTPEIATELASYTRARMIQNLLRTSPILNALPEAERHALIEHFETRSFEPGDYLTHQDQISPGLHLIASGDVDVVRSDGNERLIITSLHVGDVVGEVSLVLRRPSTADVIASVPTVTLTLPRDRFAETIKSHPTLLSQLYELAVRRDEETSSIVAQEGEFADELVML